MGLVREQVGLITLLRKCNAFWNSTDSPLQAKLRAFIYHPGPEMIRRKGIIRSQHFVPKLRCHRTLPDFSSVQMSISLREHVHQLRLQTERSAVDWDKYQGKQHSLSTDHRKEC